MSDSIGNLFGNIQADLKDLTNINQELNGESFEKDLSLDTGSKTVKLFDVPVKIDATLSAKAGVLAAGALPEAPKGFTLVKLPDGKQYTTLTVGGEITASGSVDKPLNALTIPASGSAKASFSYNHYLPADSTAKRLDALVALGSTSTLPQAADVQKLKQGELFDFEASLNIDLGLKATFGAQTDIDGVVSFLEDLNGGFTAPLKAHVTFAATAALGLSLYEATNVTVGRVSTSNEGWVRIRLERAHRSRIAFGTTMDLSIDYDLTAGPQALLDRVYAWIPRPQALETIRTIAGTVADLDTPEKWAAFKKQITGKAADVVTRLVNDSEWMQAVEASPAVKELVAISNRIVNAYAGIDAK